MNIKIENRDNRIVVTSPYHPDFPKYAKMLGGKWDSDQKTWSFDVRDEASVKDLLMDCFGTDGSNEPELVDVQITLTGSEDQTIWFAGREVARRPSRDSNVHLGAGVVVIDGEFLSGGGSRRYPRVTWKGNNITLEVRDVPAVLVLKEQERDPDNVKVVRGKCEPKESVMIKTDLIEKITGTFGGPVAEAIEAALLRALENAA